MPGLTGFLLFKDLSKIAIIPLYL